MQRRRLITAGPMWPAYIDHPTVNFEFSEMARVMW